MVTESPPAPTLSDAELLDAFRERTLSARQWNHRAHIRVAALYLAEMPLDHAHILFRVGIIRLNAAHGLVETVTRGYHETLTFVWLVLVADAIRSDGGFTGTEALLARHPELLERATPLRHYSRERLASLAARARVLEPDAAPLPGDARSPGP
jgi:hypothetical protein